MSNSSATTLLSWNQIYGSTWAAIQQAECAAYTARQQYLANLPIPPRQELQDIYGPLDGTPRPPGPADAAPVAPAAGQLPPAPEAVAPPADTGPLPGPAPAAAPVPDGGAAPVAPSAYGSTATGKSPVAVAYYDPQNGRYLTPDGQYQQQASVVAGGAAKTWKDLLPT